MLQAVSTSAVDAPNPSPGRRNSRIRNGYADLQFKRWIEDLLRLLTR